jgi:threonine synthase
VATYQGFDALTRSGGCAGVVSDDDIMAAQLSLAGTEGLYLEASSAITLAALPDLVKRGHLGSEDTVVLLGTSTGLKDVDATAALLPPVPEIRATMADLDLVMNGPR